MQALHVQCDDEGDVAIASMPEHWIDQLRAAAGFYWKTHAIDPAPRNSLERGTSKHFIVHGPKACTLSQADSGLSEWILAEKSPNRSTDPAFEPRNAVTCP